MNTFIKKSVVCFLSVLATFAATFSATYSYAQEKSFSSLYQEANGLFEKRGDKSDNAMSCAEKAVEAFRFAANDVEKYDALVLQSRCLYFAGTQVRSDDEKMEKFGMGQKVADQAKSFQDSRAEAHYYAGINLARWGEAYGKVKAAIKGKHKIVMSNMEQVLKKTAVVNGKSFPGQEYDSWGANRTLGRVYFALPRPWGDKDLSEKYLREAYEKTPASEFNVLTAVFFAEVLEANDKRDEAKKVLDYVLQFKNNPEKLNPNRLPEMVEEMRMAESLRKSLGN